MPIYEFYCRDCHTIFNFLARTPTDRRPACPRCGRPALERKPSVFAVSRGLAEPQADAPPDDEAAGRLERAMESMMAEAESIPEDDPRQGARFMRRLYEAAGLPVGGGIEEALRRMEAGEDPDAIEEDLGDVFADDPLLGEAAAEGDTDGERSRSMRRRFLPPRHDPELHDL